MEFGPEKKMLVAGVILSLIAALELYPRWRNTRGD
jgi:hypothetical protein